MKKLVVFALAIASLWSASAMAGGQWNGVTVTTIYVYPSYEGAGTAGYAKILLSANSSGGPSCATGNYNYVVVDLSTEGGAALFGIFYGLRTSGGTVNIAGYGQCQFISNAESVGYIAY